MKRTREIEPSIERNIRPVLEFRRSIERSIQPVLEFRRSIERSIQPVLEFHRSIERSIQPVLEFHRSIERSIQPVLEVRRSIERFAQLSELSLPLKHIVETRRSIERLAKLSDTFLTLPRIPKLLPPPLPRTPKLPSPRTPRPLIPPKERPPLSQNQHDTIIEIIEKSLREDYMVLSNPDKEKNISIRNTYPDLLIYDLSTLKIIGVVEVETNESVTSNEASSQWKTYSNLGYPFYLCVPKELLQDASQLINNHNVNCKGVFGYFLNNGILHANFYPLEPN
ncbi:MAG: hypothetical protein IH975_06845 [Nitrospinae bacterium]|nr:hypothetical protein [Nitrospinota bacterium]